VGGLVRPGGTHGASEEMETTHVRMESWVASGGEGGIREREVEGGQGEETGPVVRAGMNWDSNRREGMQLKGRQTGGGGIT